MSVTYGDLVGQAGVDVHVGMIAVMRHGAVDTQHAANLVGSYYDLLEALRRHTWNLVDPLRQRTGQLATAVRGHQSGGADVAAVRVFGAIGPLNPRHAWLPYPEPHFDHPWRDAADRLGAAGDLLATHLSPTGQSRSERAETVLDVANRRAALKWVAEVTSAALSCETVIGAACRQAGVAWNTVHRWLPGVDAAQSLAAALREQAAAFDVGRGLSDITVNAYPVRQDDPLVELVDRMSRLRHAAWTLNRLPDYSVVTLHDFAGLGMAIHLHTAAAHGVDLATATASTSPQVAAALAYRDLAGQLHRYLAPGLPDTSVRADILAVRQLLVDLAPPRRTGRLTKLGDHLARQTLSGLHGAGDVMAQITQMNRATFAALARSEYLQLPARAVTGAELSDDPARAQQKLTGARVLAATPARIQTTVDAYIKAAAIIPPSRTYQPPAARALHYDPPGLVRAQELT